MTLLTFVCFHKSLIYLWNSSVATLFYLQFNTHCAKPLLRSAIGTIQSDQQAAIQISIYQLEDIASRLVKFFVDFLGGICYAFHPTFFIASVWTCLQLCKRLTPPIHYIQVTDFTTTALLHRTPCFCPNTGKWRPGKRGDYFCRTTEFL